MCEKSLRCTIFVELEYWRGAPTTPRGDTTDAEIKVIPGLLTGREPPPEVLTQPFHFEGRAFHVWPLLLEAPFLTLTRSVLRYRLQPYFKTDRRPPPPPPTPEKKKKKKKKNSRKKKSRVSQYPATNHTPHTYTQMRAQSHTLAHPHTRTHARTHTEALPCVLNHALKCMHTRALTNRVGTSDDTICHPGDKWCQGDKSSRNRPF